MSNFYKLTINSNAKFEKLPDWIILQDLIPKPLVLKGKKKKFKIFVKKTSLDGDLDCVKVYSRLFKDKEYSFFLDSAKIQEERGRFSFLGCADGPLSYAVSYKSDSRDLVLRRDGDEKHYKLEAGNNFFKWISEKINDAHVGSSQVEFLNCSHVPFDFFGGFVGTFGYEMKQECYPDTDFKVKTASKMSDSSFLFIDRFLAVDHMKGKSYLVFLHDLDTNESTNMDWLQKLELEILEELKAGPVTAADSLLQSVKIPSSTVVCHHEYEKYIENIMKCQDYIKDGDSYELCLTTQFSSHADFSRTSPWDFYMALRRNNPAPYGAFFSFSDTVLACSSPELFMKVDSNLEVLMKPIKGTLPREPLLEGQDYEVWLQKDLAAKTALSCSEKDLAENLMVTF